MNIEVWLSLVERYVRDVEVASSNLVTSTRKNDKSKLVVFSIKSAVCGINPPVVDEIAAR